MQNLHNTRADGTCEQAGTGPEARVPGLSPLVSGATDEAPHGKTAPVAVDISEESVAGEEDPGAALDLLWPPPSPPTT